MSKLYTIFDTETTGLIKNSQAADDKQVRITEIAAVHMLSDGTIVEEFERLINPGVKLTEEVMNITNITQAQLDAAKPWSEHADEIAAFFDRGNVLIAHNATFDADLIRMEMQRLKGTVHTAFVMPKPEQELICTVEATEFMKGKRLKLVDLHMHLFGENFTGAHRAMTDVKALARVVAQLIRMGAI